MLTSEYTYLFYNILKNKLLRENKDGEWGFMPAYFSFNLVIYSIFSVHDP